MAIPQLDALFAAHIRISGIIEVIDERLMVLEYLRHPAHTRSQRRILLLRQSFGRPSIDAADHLISGQSQEADADRVAPCDGDELRGYLLVYLPSIGLPLDVLEQADH